MLQRRAYRCFLKALSFPPSPIVRCSMSSFVSDPVDEVQPLSKFHNISSILDSWDGSEKVMPSDHISDRSDGSDRSDRSDRRPDLKGRQLAIETEQLTEAAQSIADLQECLLKLGKGDNLSAVKRQSIKLYEPMLADLNAEVDLVKGGMTGVDRKIYGPYLLLLPQSTLTAITINSVINQICRCDNGGVKMVYISKEIGEAVWMEVQHVKMKEKDKESIASVGKHHKSPFHSLLNNKKLPHASQLLRSIKRVCGEDEWSTDVKIKVGATLLKILLHSARTPDGQQPAFSHTVRSDGTDVRNFRKRFGILTMHSQMYDQIASRDDVAATPRYLPMLVPPEPWNNRTGSGGYLSIKSPLLRTFSNNHKNIIREVDMHKVLEPLDFLGNVPWRINNAIRLVIKEAWEAKEMIGELPQQDDFDTPKEVDFLKVPEPPANQYFGPKTERQTNRYNTIMTAIETNTPMLDEKAFRGACGRVATKNRELHSLRCDINIKFWIAEKFRDDKLYFPHNVDFRGRAYPIPPNLNHMSSDLCRGLLMFADGKELGEGGLSALKVHLCNLFGNNKISFQERVEWIDGHMHQVIASAKNPLGSLELEEGHLLEDCRWWSTAEEPFQALATCVEIHNALLTGDPASYVSHLSVHVDGSCNGLQHYAALGRDKAGGSAVNLSKTVSDTGYCKPGDVYTEVLQLVLQKIEEDAVLPEDHELLQSRAHGKHARLVQGHINRKVIKQTVMTSVYGVTYIGARDQIKSKLLDILLADVPIPKRTRELEQDIFLACGYVANVTLESLGKMFQSANLIMQWLATCSTIVSDSEQVMSWITPLGLPVMQPYRKNNAHTIRTILQHFSVYSENETLPISKSQQRSAFPPNFVHSLDATHMFLTACKMREQSLTFAAVHDSYWTHACNVPELHSNLRECFVDLYSEPILENLQSSLRLRYPGKTFPPLPARGVLNIHDVKESPYFFH